MGERRQDGAAVGRQRVKGSAAGEFWEAERFKEGLRENKLFS